MPHGPLHHRHTGLGQICGILAQSTRLPHPAERALHDLSFWPYHAAVAALGASDKVHGPLAIAPQRWPPGVPRTRIGPSGPKTPQAGEVVAQQAQQALRPVTVLEARSRAQHGEEQPEGLNEEMTFSSFPLFRTVKAFGTPTIGGCDRLGVQASGPGVPGAPQKRPQIPAPDVMNTVPRSVFAPEATVIAFSTSLFDVGANPLRAGILLGSSRRTRPGHCTAMAVRSAGPTGYATHPTRSPVEGQRIALMPLALYMDHHVPRAITVGLRLRGVEVITAYEDGSSHCPGTGTVHTR